MRPPNADAIQSLQDHVDREEANAARSVRSPLKCWRCRRWCGALARGVLQEIVDFIKSAFGKLEGKYAAFNVLVQSSS